MVLENEVNRKPGGRKLIKSTIKFLFERMFFQGFTAVYFSTLRLLLLKKIAVRGTLLFLLVTLVGFGYAQDTPFTCSEVVKVDSAKKETLYLLAKQWIDSTYASPLKVIQADSKDSAAITIKAAFVVFVTDAFVREGGIVEYTMNIQCKDGRYKLSLGNFIHHHSTSDLGDGGDLNRLKAACSPLNLPKYYWHQIKEQAAVRRNNLVASVKRALGQTPQKTDKGDW